MSVINGGFSNGVALGRSLYFPTIADFNGDGLAEPLGFVNTGAGTFASTSYAGIDSVLAQYPGRVHRDNRVFDIDGDGHLDILWNVYADPSHAASFSLIFYGDGAGNFDRHEERRDLTGYGETIVVADFNNDGWSDTYLPTYTHVEGTDSAYLLLNHNGVLGANVAQEWGVGLSGQSVFYRVEGAQAADVDFDGRIDMFVGSHLFLNQGDRFEAQVLDPFVFDEGSNLFDFDNDGDFDLVLRLENRGPELFENVDGAFVTKGCLTGSEVITGFGVNVVDFDNNGWQDIVFGGPGCLSVLFNFGGEFTRRYIPVDTGDAGMSEMPCCGTCQHDAGVCEALAVADVDNDGRLDIFGRAGGNMFFFSNQLEVGPSLTLSVRGSNGEQNQHGRSVKLTPRDGSGLVMARTVDSGSGYLSQGQYDLLVGLPATVGYDVAVHSATGPLTFVASAGQKIVTFAGDRVTIAGSEAADIMGGAAGADFLAGHGGDDVFLGSSGEDQIDGGAGADTIDWSSASDNVIVDLGTGQAQYLGATQILLGVENARGSAFADVLIGSAEINRLDGGRGADRLVSVGEGDVLAGGEGDDNYLVQGALALIVEAEGEGVDTVETDLPEFALPDHVEQLRGLSDAGQVLIGNGLANLISGAAGADTFRGGDGDDVYLVQAGDLVEENADGGADEVRTALAVYALTDEVERLTGTSAAGQILTGNALANVLSGGAGADTFAAGAGDDVYYAGEGDLVHELADEGIDEVRTNLVAYSAPDEVEVITGLASVSQHMIGNGGSNIFAGGLAGDRFEGRFGDDVYFVEAGDIVIEELDAGLDEVRTALSTYTLPEHVERLVGLGAAGQKLIGNAGDNVLVAGGGPDTLVGGAGNDTYVVNSILDFIQEKVEGGFDTVRAIGSYGLYVGANVERVEAFDAAGVVAMNLGGNEFSQTITGNAGANLLAGGGGGDVFIGLDGNDTYAIDDPRDVVIEVQDQGYDRVASFFSYALAPGSSIELLYARDISSTTAISLTGNTFAQTIQGNAGNNLLSGGGGGDVLMGFGGNDTYVIDDATDLVVEADGQGFDRVATFISYALDQDAAVEHLYARDITNTAAITLTGNRYAQSIHGNAGANVLDGRGGADTLAGFGGDDEYRVDSADDVVIELLGNGTDIIRSTTSYSLQAAAEIEFLSALDPESEASLNLTGNRFAQTITGNAGANLLAGGGGGDVLIGGRGNDTYAIDDVRDVVQEHDGEGFDRVATFISYTLDEGASIEHLYARDIASQSSIRLTGNSFSQSIHGNGGANVLIGGGGSDTLAGFGGDDEYHVDSADDVVLETAGNGTDTVFASVSYVLRTVAEVEFLTAADSSSTTALDLTGSRFAQTLTGNAGNNVLAGAGGGDVLIGLAGDDTYAVDDARDTIVELEGEGFDSAASFVSYTLAQDVSIEYLYARDIASSTAIDLTGNRFAQSIYGNAGDNILDGGGGQDTLVGFGGRDIFLFSTTPSADDITHILDFTVGQDKIGLDARIFSPSSNTLELGGNLQSGLLGGQPASVRYDAVTGDLLFEPASPAGQEVQIIAKLTPGLAISASDFVIFG